MTTHSTTTEKLVEGASRRLRLLSVVVICGLVLLVTALFRVQIVKGAFYDQRLRLQSLRSIKLPAVRGRIYDRNKVCLADNRPSYDVALHLQELRRAGTGRQSRAQVALRTAQALGQTLNLPSVGESTVRTHLAQKPAVPLVLWHDLDPQKVAVFGEQVAGQCGVELVVSARRHYPFGLCAAHVTGQLGRQENDAEDELANYYLRPEMVGKSGMESVMEEDLRGRPGGRITQIDALGYSERIVSEIKPEAGADAVLTIDVRLQQLTEEALASAPMPHGRPVRGAVVVVDVTNGDVLAMASRPSFDPNLFARGITTREFSQLNQDPGKPFLNRAIQGLYPPGSVFKPFVMLAGLESGAIDHSSSTECTGAMRISHQIMRCWAASGHGRVGIVDAMRVSCDQFFYQHGIRTGIRAIKQMAEAFGFGARSGFPLSEAKGFLPDELWLRQKKGQQWTDAHTASVAIGQAEVLVTPLQMALATAALANGGVLWHPRLLLRIESQGQRLRAVEPAAHRKVPVSAEHLQLVRRMMLEVVEARDGTGWRARVPGLKVAGKTGTAEVGPPDKRRHVTWFIAFAPFEQPRYALAVVIEDGDHGGTTAAPVAGKILAGIWGLSYQMPRETESNDVD